MVPTRLFRCHEDGLLLSLLLRHRQKQYIASPFLQTRRALSFGPFDSFTTRSRKPLRLTASQLLPYAPPPLFRIISDVSAYSAFLPFCLSSVVHSYSRPDLVTNTQWPHRATLTIGYGSFEERYTSCVYCVPWKIVEAVSGNARPSDAVQEAAGDSYLEDDLRTAFNGTGNNNGVFRHLITRWELTPVRSGLQSPACSSRDASDYTRVDLVIEYDFANPLYATLAKAAAPAIAPKMMEAFQKRVAYLEKQGKI